MVKKTEQLNDGPTAVSSSIQSTAASGPKPTSHLASSTSNRPHASFKPQIQNTSATANVKRPVPSQFQNLTRGSNGKFLPRSSNNGNSMAGVPKLSRRKTLGNDDDVLPASVPTFRNLHIKFCQS